MKKFLLLSLLTIAFSCTKTEDDTTNNCSMNCTTLSGNFLTSNNEPLSNVEVSFDYKVSGTLGGGKLRKIARTKTDSKGNYSVDFYLKDEELGNSDGYFTINVNDKNLDSNKFIGLNNNADLGYNIFSIQNRDTIIDASFFIPKKAYIKINLNNYVPQQAGDFFEVKTIFPQGLKNKKKSSLDSYYSSGIGPAYSAEVKNQSFNIVGAEGEKNDVVISRRKNGVTFQNEIHQIFVTPNTSIELTFDY